MNIQLNLEFSSICSITIWFLFPGMCLNHLLVDFWILFYYFLNSGSTKGSNYMYTKQFLLLLIFSISTNFLKLIILLMFECLCSFIYSVRNNFLTFLQKSIFVKYIINKIIKIWYKNNNCYISWIILEGTSSVILYSYKLVR